MAQKLSIIFFWGDEILPTIRSHYTIDQFNEVLQKLAHKTAIDAVKHLKEARIVIRGGHRISEVEANNSSFRFYANHIRYSVNGRWYPTWGFDVEEKLYLTSNHGTKISFWAPEGKLEETQKKILEFIDKIMAEASMKPVQRFELSKYSGQK